MKKNNSHLFFYSNSLHNFTSKSNYLFKKIIKSQYEANAMAAFSRKNSFATVVKFLDMIGRALSSSLDLMYKPLAA